MTCQVCSYLRTIFPELGCSCEYDFINLGLRGTHVFKKPAIRKPKTIFDFPKTIEEFSRIES